MTEPDAVTEQDTGNKLQRLTKVLTYLESLLRPEVKHVMSLVKDGIQESELFVNLPDPSDADLAPSQLATYVASTSNAYSELCRLHGMISAQVKISEARYKIVYRKAKAEGKNEAEREANATAAAEEQILELALIESVYEIVTSLMNAARVASESARKLYDKSFNMP